MAAKPLVHFSGAACPSSDRADAPTWAAADQIACGVPRAVDRNARYYATADKARVTCSRCLGAKVLSFVGGSRC